MKEPEGEALELISIALLDEAQWPARLGETPGQEEADAPATRPGARWRCASCAQVIASPEDGLAIGGHHEHAFCNPHGYLYRVGCFGEARGLAPVGEETLAWSWFAGFAWTIMVCGVCDTHLGWRYRASSGGRVFFGLILDRLALGEASDALD